MTPQNRMIAKKRKNQVEGHRRGKTGKQKTEKKGKKKRRSRKTKKQISREPGKTEKQGSIKKNENFRWQGSNTATSHFPLCSAKRSLWIALTLPREKCLN